MKEYLNEKEAAISRTITNRFDKDGSVLPESLKRFWHWMENKDIPISTQNTTFLALEKAFSMYYAECLDQRETKKELVEEEALNIAKKYLLCIEYAKASGAYKRIIEYISCIDIIDK